MRPGEHTVVVPLPILCQSTKRPITMVSVPLLSELALTHTISLFVPLLLQVEVKITDAGLCV